LKIINSGGTHLVVGPTIYFIVPIYHQVALSIYFKQMKRILTWHKHIHFWDTFARIRVEIVLEQLPVTYIFIEGYKYFLKYEDFHSICCRWGRYGHTKERCGKLLGEATIAMKNTTVVKVKDGEETTSFSNIVLLFAIFVTIQNFGCI
jgi:hypothetical protein